MIHQFTAQGTAGEGRPRVNQDRMIGYAGPEYIIIAAADGVSAARSGAAGAQIACDTAAKMLRRDAGRIFAYPGRKLAYLMLEQILYEIERQAGGAETGEYASTLMFACVRRSDGAALLWNLGDGCVLQAGSSGAVFEMAPRRYGGQPCQITTREAYRAVEIRKLRLRRGDAVVLMTDGVLEAAQRQPALIRAACRADLAEMERLSQQTEFRDDASWIALRYLG